MSHVDLQNLDLGRLTFASAPYPLLESVASLRSLCHGRDARRRDAWQEWVAARLPGTARPLLDLVAVGGDALMVAAVPEEDLERALAVVRALPGPMLLDRLAEAAGGRGVPAWVAAFVGADGGARQRLGDALRDYHASCVLPYWRRVWAGHARESARFAHRVLDVGVRAAVAELLPCAGPPRGARGGRPDPDARGGAVVLTPSLFWSGRPWLGTLSHGATALVYRPPDAAATLDEEPPDRLDALRQLLGHTRAEVLTSLTRPCGTTELASRIRMSVATTSEHATVLRAAGLVHTTRHGRSVRHMLTDLGRRLVHDARS